MTGLAVVACASRPLPDLSSLPEVPSDYPVFEDSASRGLRFQVIQGRLQVGVRREGPMARLGHDHLVSGPIDGHFSRRGRTVRADLFVPVAQLVVDDPQERARQGGRYDRPVPEADRHATRANLLSESVLDAQRHGFVRAVINDAVDEAGQVEVAFTLAGRNARQRVKIEIADADPCHAHFQGRFALEHGDFGLEPFAAVGGALRVSEVIEVSFNLTARADHCP